MIGAVSETLTRWPAGRRSRDDWRWKQIEKQECRTTCGWHGCGWSVEGRHIENLARLDRHRLRAHPDFVPYKRPRVPRAARVGARTIL